MVAFDIADFATRDYAFYMFNFRSEKHTVPGASDLLLLHVIKRAQADGKRYLNLGLGIDAGVAFFKKKWGGRPFRDYISCTQKSGAWKSWDDMLDSLLRH